MNCCLFFPVVAAERRSGQALAIIEAGAGIVAPGVAHGNGLGNFDAGDKEGITVLANHRFGGSEDAVCAGQFKALHGTEHGKEAVLIVLHGKADTEAVPFPCGLFENWAAIDDLFAVGACECDSGEAAPDWHLAARMDVECVAHVQAYSLTGCR